MRCLLCSVKTDHRYALCALCCSDMPHLNATCTRCAEIIPSTLSTPVCGKCSQQPPPFTVTLAPFDYLSPIDYLITQLKFSGNLAAARVLAHLLLTHLQHHYTHQPPWPQVIVPIPLHRQRIYSRGFNQAVEIAKPIAKTIQKPIDIIHCHRSKNTAAQSSLPAKQRENNVQNAFTISQPFPYQHVAILDDVITTGHTITTFAKQLKKAGAQRIDVWAIARAQVN